ncbi:hypothetical protein TDB9533_00600 [Thalassocella blandensis]|nr:hypothetical protein TDB9533_00600 [Thalassocella blandensis]
MLTEVAISAAGSAIGSEIAGSIIEKAKQSLEQVIENTSIRFKNIGQDLIAQLTISIDGLVKQIGDELNKTVNELSDTLKVQLHNLTLTIDKLVKTTLNDVNDLTDDVIRDIRATVSKTWFMTEIYALDDIQGTLIPSNVNSDWTIKASGLNIGFDSEDIESVIKLRIKLPNSADYETTGAEISAHSVEFLVPFEIVDEYRKRNTVTILEAELIIKIKKDGLLWFDKKFKGTQRFKITLAPIISGQLFVRTISPLYRWEKKPDLDIVYSNALPSGHATSSSKVGHHRISRRFDIARASVPPRDGDKRFYAAERGGCSGGGCSHLHDFRVNVINNGSTIDVYTYNNSHAITVKVIGKIERFERYTEESIDLAPVNILNGEIIEIKVPKAVETILITGNDLDFGTTHLVAKCKPEIQLYPMPEGEFGGIQFLGSHKENEEIVYRFMRR